MKFDDTSKLKTITSKARRYGYHAVNFPSFEELQEDNDETLFISTLHSLQHVLCQLLPLPNKLALTLFPWLRTRLTCTIGTFTNIIVGLRALRSLV